MGAEITRAHLRRALVVNALTKPVNLAVPTVIVAAALVLGTWWLVAVAAVVYVALAGVTFLNEDEARQVGERVYGQRLETGARRVDPGRLAAPIAAPLSAALDEEARFRRTVVQARLPFDELRGEVSELVEAIGHTAQRAQLVHDYLMGQRPDRVRQRVDELRRSGGADPAAQRTIAALSEQLEAQAAMARHLERFHAEMEQTVASLSTIHARVVQVAVASDDAAEHELAVQVRNLREQVDALSDGINEAYARGEPSPA
jgi:hypothetical protein